MSRTKKILVVKDSSQIYTENNQLDGSPVDETKEKIEDLNNSFVDEKEQKEKPKSKYKKKKEEEELNSKEFSKFVSGIASMSIDIIISRQKNPIPLSEKEKEQIDGSFDALIQKYIPKVEKFKEELAFTVALSMIIIPRTTIIDKLINKNESKKEAIPDTENKNA